MSTYTYTVEPDHRGDRALWRHVGNDDPFPSPIGSESARHPEVFRAAAAVLAPDDEVRNVADEVRNVAANAVYKASADVFEQADAVLAALKDHATEGETP